VGPPSILKPASCQAIYFYFYLEYKILHSDLGTQPPVSGVVMESPKQGRGVRSTILVDVKGSEIGLFDEVGSIYTREILKVFRDDNWLPVEQ